MPLCIQKGQYLTLRRIRTLDRKGFDWNKEYQRSKAWNLEKQQKLIESILKDLSIGMLILKKRGNVFEVLDGQQRLETIFSFIEGKFSTPADFDVFPEKKYTDLEENPDLSAIFDAFRVYYDEIHGGTDEQLADIFLRLQEGEPLRPPEKLNAMLGKMRNYVFEISKTPIFKKGVKIDELRFAHRYLAAQIVILELKSDFDHGPFPEFADPRFAELKKMYIEYKPKNVPRKVRKEVYGTLNFLYATLQQDARVIRKKSDLLMVYFVTSYLRKKYVVKPKSFKKFITDFFAQIAQIKMQEGQPPKNDFERYAALRRKGLTSETLVARFKIMLGLFLSHSPKMRLKDPKRLFDVGQKLAIYYHKNKGKCQYRQCLKEVKWEDASFHHTKFHSKGGPTTVQNGQLMHQKCHKKFHDKQGQDDDIS
jgi:hypothetical protein